MGICSSDNRIKNKLKNKGFYDCPKFIPTIKIGKVIKVYDGDTITIATYYNNSIYRFSVRLNGIDCPELKTFNIHEKEIAIIAKETLSNMIMDKFVNLENISYDKYGRILADVYYKKTNLSQYLLANKLAVEYDGGSKRVVDWYNYYNNRTII
jgi:endonuclease YncB( thermonuclease family)